MENINRTGTGDGNTYFNWRYLTVKRLIILGSVLLLVSMGIFSSGCTDGKDEAKVDCAEVFLHRNASG